MDPIELTLGDRKLVVHTLRVRDSAKVERLRQEAIAAPVEDVDVQVLREYFYPVLYATTSGDVPTEEEFLDMPVVEANYWFDACNKINPGLLPSAAEEEVDDEKKES